MNATATHENTKKNANELKNQLNIYEYTYECIKLYPKIKKAYSVDFSLLVAKCQLSELSGEERKQEKTGKL